jgi:Holliday junction DNA helicase RuvA
VKLLVHFVVREDAHMLYGFKTQEERQLFRSFLSVNGIGPKLALTVLSGIPMETLKRAIVRGELETLTGISGIGKKTAERIIVELREKLVLQAQPEAELEVSGTTGQTALMEDSVEALIALGYRRPNAKTAIEKAMKIVKAEQMTVEELIRTSLKHV